MNIVTNNYMLRYFKTINLFKVDLGKNLKGPVGKRNSESIIMIRDEFIKKYQSLNRGKIIMKYGEIGTLKFYEDGQIPANIFHIYDKEQIYEIQASQDDLKKDATAYLTEILQMIEDAGDEPELEYKNVIKDVSYTNMPEDIERPDISQPRDQYLENLLNRRKLIEKTSKR